MALSCRGVTWNVSPVCNIMSPVQHNKDKSHKNSLRKKSFTQWVTVADSCFGLTGLYICQADCSRLIMIRKLFGMTKHDSVWQILNFSLSAYCNKKTANMRNVGWFSAYVPFSYKSSANDSVMLWISYK